MNRRNSYQKYIFKEMSNFWSPEGKRSLIARPWRHELHKGIVYVYWRCYEKNLREKTNLGILLDWCDEHDLKHYYKPIEQIRNYQYFRFHIYKYFPFVLTVEIPSGS